MSKIRKLYFFDKKKIDNMISFLNNNEKDNYINSVIFNPFLILHHFLPLNFKFLPESYILEKDGKIKGLITVAPTKSKNKKIEIQKLLLEDEALDDASELVKFVVSKYKAMGIFSIFVKVDDYLPDIASMLVTECGFSQISSEKLWRVNKEISTEYNRKEVRLFRNSDAKSTSKIYNESLLPHFRPLLGVESADFKENICNGLSCYSEYRYVFEDKKNKKINKFLTITTYDNENYVIDITSPTDIDLNLESTISYAIYQIRKRKNRFGLFIRSKKYMQLGDKYEQFFTEKGFECVQNQLVLTNSTAKVLKEDVTTEKYTVLNDFLPTKPIST